MLTHISFATVPVIDPDLALQFYLDLLGMIVSVDAPFGDQRWIMLAIPSTAAQLRLEPVKAMPEEGGAPPPIIAPDVAAVVRSLRRSGVSIIRDPGPADWDATVMYALIRDSEGNVVLLASA